VNTVGKIHYKEIKRISPSQFYSMKNCAYKGLLAEAFDKRPLLPISPNAYFGTVSHNMLELIAKGVIKNEDDFNRIFDEQVKVVEENLQGAGYSFFIPLQKNVNDFGLKKILLKKHLHFVSELPARVCNVNFYSEKWFESKDKLIAGKIDLVIETGDNIEIIDFKTGAITEDILDDTGEVFTEVKEEYKDQLKLYAYLYYENTGKFPTNLSLVDLAKQKFTVEFSQSECNAIFEEARNLLHFTNECISKGAFNFNPTVTNCMYCLYRPACSIHRIQIEKDSSFNDVAGSIKKVVKYQNGNVSVFLQCEKNQFTITSFPSEKYDYLNDSKKKQISIYNLRKEAIEFVYSATKSTIIYEENNRI